MLCASTIKTNFEDYLIGKEDIWRKVVSKEKSVIIFKITPILSLRVPIFVRAF